MIYLPHRRKAFRPSGGGGVQPSVRATAESMTTDRKSPWTATNPTNSEDDILMCFIFSDYGSNPSWSATSGWTALFSSPIDYGNGTCAVQWKRSTGSETNPTISAWDTGGGPGRDVYAIIISVQDCITTGSPVDVFSSVTDQSLSNSYESSTVTPTVDDGLVLFFGTNADTTDASFSTSPPPAGWTLVHNYTGSITYVTSYDTATENGVDVTGVVQSTSTGANAHSHELTFVLKPAA